MSLMDQQWCPTSAQVTVLQARGLRIKGKSGTNDAYAVMQVGKEKYQTSVVEKSVAPVWKEEAAFDLPQPQQGSSGGGGGGGGGGTDRSTLHVHVLHRALVGPDKLLGQAVINLLQLSEDKTRNKTEWFKLLDKTGKPDKDRGEVLVDIQFMRNNMTASMFDLSAAGKSRSRLGKFKDKVRGKKKESDAVSTLAPSFTQVLTDSEEERDGDAEVAAGKDEKKKKNKMKSLFSPKSNLQKNMSQSMSVLPGKNSSLSGSQSSGLNVDPSEGKKKFKFKIHKRSGSSDSKVSSSGYQKHSAAEQSNLCINGSHVYCEEPQPRNSRIGSNFSLASSGHGSMEDVPESSPPSVDSSRGVRQYSPWTEEEEEMAEEENIKEEVGELKEEDDKMRRQEEVERLAEEKRRQERMRIEEEKRQREEEERKMEEKRAQEERRIQEEEEERKLEEEKRRLEEEERMIEEERARKEEEERVRREEEERERLAEEKGKLEEQERRRIEEEEKRQREEEERVQMEEKKAQEERRRQEEEERVRMEEERAREERRRQEEEERVRMEEERAREERRRQEEEERVRMEEERAREERRRQEEEERVRMEEEKAQEERRRQEEEERAMRQEEERERLAEEKRRLEEEERRRIEEEEKRQREEEEERVRIEEERALEERRRYEEECKLAEEKRRLEEEERRRIEEEKARKEEEERIRREEEDRIQEERRRQEEEELMRRQEEEREQKRRLQEQERRQREEEEMLRREEEEKEKARKEKEEYERLVEEKRKQEEEERKRIETEEKIRKEEEERMRLEEERRRQEEEREKLAEEKRIREEQERKRIEEEEKRQREEEERIRKEEERRREEEERARKEKEEYERLVEEQMRQEQEKKRVEEEERRRQEEQERIRMENERRMRQEEEDKIKKEEEERIRREKKAEEERKEEEVKKLEKVMKNAEEEKKRENKMKRKAPEMKSKVESPSGVTSTNPFDENFSNNPFEETAGPDSSKVSAVQQRNQSAVSSLGNKTASNDEKDLISAQREKRAAPQPPGRNQAEKKSQREQDGSAQHLAQINKKSKDKDVKTVTVPPQRSVRMIAPLSRSPAGVTNTQSVTQSSSTKGTTNVAKHSKRPAPSRPRSVEEGPSSESKTASSSAPVVYGLNPFEDDEDEDVQGDMTTNTGAVQWPPAVSQAADKDASSRAKIKSSKTAQAPPLPAKKASTSSTSANQNTEVEHVTDHSVHVQETPLQESKPATLQSAGEGAGGKKEGPPTTSRRLQPVKPLNPLEQQTISVVQEETDDKSTGTHSDSQEKTKVNDSGLKGPYSQLTREELVSLLRKQENQLSDRDKKISELEQYIDNLLVRVMEEKPTILLSMNSMKKSA